MIHFCIIIQRVEIWKYLRKNIDEDDETKEKEEEDDKINENSIIEESDKLIERYYKCK